MTDNAPKPEASGGLSDDQHRVISELRAHGWIVVKPSGMPDRWTCISSPARQTIAVLAGGQILAELSPFDAEVLARDLVSLAEDTIAHPEYGDPR